MSAPVLPQIPCQKCASQGRQAYYQETENGRYADNEGLLCSRLMCFRCGTQPQAGVRLISVGAPCRRCIHQESGYVRAGPELNAANSSVDFLNAMRTQAIPDSHTFLNQVRPNSVPGGGQ